MKEDLKKIIIELLAQMGFESEIYERQEEGRLVLNIKTADAQLLIGKQGANLEALQHLVYLLARKHDQLQDISFGLDIDDYREKRVIFLKEVARKAAHQVRATRRSVMLPVMPASERRIIHNYLSLFSDISSESSGKDPDRRIVIRQKKTEPKGPFEFIENS